MRTWLVPVLLVAALLMSLAPVSGPMQGDAFSIATSPATGRPEMKLADAVPGAFTLNMGQVENADVLFYAGSGVAFGKSSVMLQVAGSGTQLAMIRLCFVNANAVLPEGLQQAPWHSNHFMGNDSSKWITGIPNYAGVIYRDLWDGIDLVYRMTDSGLKYDFIVSPGADPAQISIWPEGHESMYLAAPDSLTIATGLGTAITDSHLDVFYADAPSEKLEAEFTIGGNGAYSFRVSGWNSSRAMIIDPLMYSTFLGGTGQDSANAVATDSFGNAYVTGQTASVKFSSRPGILQTGGTSGDVFVVKLAPDGDSVLYVAVIGGQEFDVGHAIAVDQNGNAYVTGETFSEGFPVSDAAFDRSYNGVGDAFVLKLSQSGDSLVYSTFLGGRHDDAGYGIVIDGNGQAHVTGRTWSGNFHTTGGAFSTAPAGDADAFLTKIADTGDYLVYSTYLGGFGSDSGIAVALDPEGNAIVTGTCMPAGFPLTDGAMNSSGAGTDVFVTKFGKNGNAPIFSAVLGGFGSDSATGIVISPDGIIHIVGNTDSADFPRVANSSSSASRGGKDIFVAGLNSSGDALVHSAYLGGSGDDTASGISMDPDGRLFITGMTASKDFPVTSGALATALKGGSDAFISMLNATWSGFEYSTYLGGSLDDAGLGISVSMTGCPIVAGVTASQDFRMIPGSPWPVHSGGNDGFLAKMDIIAPIAVAGGDITANESTVVQFNGSVSTDNEAIVSYAWNLIDGVANITLNGSAPSYIFIRPGKYNVTLEVRDKVGNSAIDNMTVTILEYPYPIARAGGNMTADIGAPVTFNGMASTDNGAIIRYAWSFHDGLNNASVEGREPIWVFRVPGNYTAVLEVTDDDGNTDSDMFNITVKDVSEPVARPGEFITVSRGSAAYLDGSASTDNAGIANFTWTFMHNGTAVSISGANSSFVFWEPGEHEVVLTVTDAAGNTDSNIILVTVQDSGESGNMLGPFMLIASLLFLCFAIIMSRKNKVRNSGKEGGEGD